MKNIGLLLLSVLLLTACQHSANPLIHRWEEINHTMSMNIKADSSIRIKQYHKNWDGKWRLSDDEKILTISIKNLGDKELLIKALTNDSMVLSDNGNDIVFRRKKLL